MGTAADVANRKRHYHSGVLKMTSEEFFLRSLRFVGRRIFSKEYRKEPKLPLPLDKSGGGEASALIYETLCKDKPCMITRFGSVELGCVVNYLQLAKKNYKSIFQYMKGESVCFEWAEKVRFEMNNNAGFFPPTDDNLERFSRLMLECIPNIDILGSWRLDEILVKEKMPNAKIVDLPDLEPYYHSNPWSRILKGKTVLVIHPFAETIKSQYLKRDKLFLNKEVLPEFKLETIQAVQSIANNDCGYKNWFEALEAMKLQISQKEYDVAIIGCGAYGFPLASFVKDQGKKAVHLGGAVQILFGIKCRRWDENPYQSSFYNEYWVRASKEETPKNAELVENACYW